MAQAQELQPPFLLGEAEGKWGAEIPLKEDSPLTMRLGTRLQTVTAYDFGKDIQTDETVDYQDFYVRRARFQVEVRYQEGIKFYMDVRNDNVNKGDKGEGDFNLGDAYIEVPNVFQIEGLNFRAFRAKVNVSRIETISSSELLFVDRPAIADAAAQFVSHNRRASNVQLLGNFDHWYFQIVAGDGVQSGAFEDATGDDLSNGGIDSQNFMVGGKLVLSPIPGWEDDDPTSTYLGRGQHFSFGGGIFHTGDIEYQSSGNPAQDGEVSRTLVNGELSFHYQNLSMISEYFQFQGVVEDLEGATQRIGSSDGYYIQGEYVFPNWSYIAPFLRYERWDRFNQADDYGLTSKVAGVNWYLKGNKIRVGLYYQYDEFEENLHQTDDRGREFDSMSQVKLTSMWHY